MPPKEISADNVEKLEKFHDIFSKKVDTKIPKTKAGSFAKKAAGFSVGFAGVAFGIGAVVLGTYAGSILVAASGISVIAGSVETADRMCRPDVYCYRDSYAEFCREDKDLKQKKRELRDIYKKRGLWDSFVGFMTHDRYGKYSEDIAKKKDEIDDLLDGYSDLFRDYRPASVAKNFDNSKESLEKKISDLRKSLPLEKPLEVERQTDSEKKEVNHFLPEQAKVNEIQPVSSNYLKMEESASSAQNQSAKNSFSGDVNLAKVGVDGVDKGTAKDGPQNNPEKVESYFPKETKVTSNSSSAKKSVVPPSQESRLDSSDKKPSSSPTKPTAMTIMQWIEELLEVFGLYSGKKNANNSADEKKSVVRVR